MPDQDTPEAGAGSPPCDCCCPSMVCPGQRGQLVNMQNGEVIAEGVVSVNPETGRLVFDLEPPAVVEGPEL